MTTRHPGNRGGHDDPAQAAAALLAARPYSIAGLTRKLIERGFEPEDVEKTIEAFINYGYLNDAEFAQTVARHYTNKGFGRRRIEQELFSRGVDRGTMRDVLEALPEPGTTLDALVADALKAGMPEDEKSRRRLVSRLQRKGFDWDDIRDALSRYDEDTQIGED